MQKNLTWRAVALACGVAVGALGGHGVATAQAPQTKSMASKAAKRYTIEQFMATTRIGGASFNAEESRVLFHSDVSGIFNLYSVPVGGGTPMALTSSKTDSHYAVSYFPQDDRVLYTRDQGGNELNHLYVRELDGREMDLTPGQKLKADFEGWTPDGSGFYVSTNERDPRFFDLYRYDSKTYVRTLVFKNEQGFGLGPISRDGRYLSLSKANTQADNDTYLYDTRTGQTTHISKHQGVASITPSDFTPDGKRLLLLSNEGSEFTRVVAHDIATGQKQDVEKADWDVVYSLYSHDGRIRVTGVNADASTTLRLEKDGKPMALPQLPGGEVRNVRVANSGGKMAFYLNGDRSPSNLYVLDFKTGKTTQLTQSLSKEIDPKDLVDSKVVRFNSFDGMVIPSVYWEPKGASPQAKVPAVLLVHGGPGGQTTRNYNALAQYLANHGYAVLGINNRGSSGYGKTFFTADDGKHGREPLWDCIEAKTYLAGTGVIDPERIGIMGGSYGGYMTLAALAFRPEVFKVGVNIFGVSNWVRTLESIPPYWESFRLALYQEVGDPVKDKDFLIATSPLFHAKEIRKPLLVIQGANDPRVIKPESDDIVSAVKKSGVPVEYIVFDDEGHGFSKKANQAKANAAIKDFLDKYLKP